MTLGQLLLFSALALVAAPFFRRERRGWPLLVGSVLAVYWLQPATPIRNLDFWLPTATLTLSAAVWAVTRKQGAEAGRQNLITGAVLLVTVLAIGATRYINPICCLTPSRPPQMAQILAALALSAILAAGTARFLSGRPRALALASALLLGIFVALKSAPLAEAASAGLRGLTGQSLELASAFDIRWLGFSYVAFRLLHVLADRLAGRLPDLTLRDFVSYIIFFPALTAGPIDRVERFTGDLKSDFRLNAALSVEGLRRIAMGVFMKFVLADSLAVFALDASNVFQTRASAWMWVLLYAYSLRIYLDFAGYTHIAIGIGGLVGVRLPENFAQPYFKANLTAFWNSWHMTLAQWFRSYYFNPLTRALRGGRLKLSVPSIILIGQVSTMALIGLWHGISWNFLTWGLWHGLGLFVHNRWADFAKGRFAFKNQGLVKLGGALLTFHFVALGWVWFGLATPKEALYALRILFGLGR